MILIEEKNKLEEIVNKLSEEKIKEIIDFAGYLMKKEESEENLNMQLESDSYNEWLNQGNDIYDEVFKNDIK